MTNLKKVLKLFDFSKHWGMNMNTDELFTNGYNLPQPLSEEEFYSLLEKSRNGSKEARNKILKIDRSKILELLIKEYLN